MFRQLKSSGRGSPHTIDINMVEDGGAAPFVKDVKINDPSEAALQASYKVCAGAPQVATRTSEGMWEWRGEGDVLQESKYQDKVAAMYGDL